MNDNIVGMRPSNAALGLFNNVREMALPARRVSS